MSSPPRASPSDVPLAAPPAAAAPRTYAPLPPHSVLLREPSAGGGVVITAAAGRVDARARLAAQRASAVAAAICSALPLLLGAAVLGPMAWRHRIYFPSWPTVLAGVVSAAIFALMWHVLYGRGMDVMGRARRQSTVLAIDPGRIVVETTGPLGDLGLDVPGDEIRGVRVERLRGILRDSPPPRAGAVVIELRDAR